MSRSSPSNASRPRSSARTVLVLSSLLAVPWSVQTYAGGTIGDATFLFAWGLLAVDPLSVTTTAEFLFAHTRGLPEYILAWPLSSLLYGLALVSAVAGWRAGREDPRVTAGLLVVAAVAQARLAWGFSVQPTRTAWPVGAVALLAATWVCYGPVVRAQLGLDG
ncbi:TIGR04206 family protein [Halobellus sp. GM3]|uniref:TIGR04206 family protein n=1 Tax=Halobellus sp. GM3 TaxID=3458410 RepID=UPI00403E30CE